MTKITLLGISSTASNTILTSFNSNNVVLTDALENTISRDGTAPNQMNALFDMNNNKIINLPAALSGTEPVRKAEFDVLSVGLNSAIATCTAAANSSASSAAMAAASATLSLNSYTTFHNLYLGGFTTDPVLDNSGNALQVGAIYFNNATNLFKSWNGTTWVSLTGGGGGGGTPGGSSGQVQYNSAGTFAGFTMSGDATLVPSTGILTLNAVANSKLATMAANTFKINNTGSTATPIDGTVAQVNAMLNSTIAPAFANVTSKPTTLSGYGITDAQPLDTDLTALAANAGTGLWAVTGSGTGSVRTLTAPAAGMTITNPAGIAGNPTIVLANDLNAIEGLAGTGIAVRTGSDTWAQRTLTGTAAEITVTNGDGVAGNPTVSIPTAVTLTGKTLTGGTFASPTLTTPSLGVATATSINGATITSGTLNGSVTGTNTGDQTITLTGDVTGSGTGSFAATIPAGTVTLTKMATLAANSILGNNTGSAATPIALTTAQTKTLLAISLSSDVTGTLQAAQFPAQTGDVTNTAGSLANVISAGAVTLAKMATLAANSLIGNNTGSSATPLALTVAQVTAFLALFSSTLQGLVPASGGGTANYLRADGSWSTPPGTGGILSGSTTVAFTDGDTARRFTVTDAAISSSNKVIGTVRRPDSTDDTADKGYLYTFNIVKQGTGTMDVFVTARDWAGDDCSDDPPNETLTFNYVVI
jgi:hypothetical protein